MATTEERLQILKMIEQGTISAGEGAELLRALDQPGKGSSAKTPLKGPSPPRWLRVRITDLKTGASKVNVNIPMGLVDIGMKMGARFAPEMQGVDYDEIVSAIHAGQQGKIIDISDEESGEHVEIFVE